MQMQGEGYWTGLDRTRGKVSMRVSAAPVLRTGMEMQQWCSLDATKSIRSIVRSCEDLDTRVTSLPLL